MNDKLSAPLDEFKERELEVINLMAEGLSNKEIADQLYITKETVRWYNKQIYSKLGTSRRTEAIALAREMGLIGNTQTENAKAIRHKLPTTTGPFIGRDNDLKDLSDLLHNPDIRLLSIIATGGMGKSRLSLELGHLINGNYEHGVVFIDLTSIQNHADIAEFLLSSLGLNIVESQTVQETLFDYCREKELLLIFDNFEHVLSGARLLTDILDIAPRVKIITTSREKLNLRVETSYQLEPILDDGKQLFIEIALLREPTLKITEDDYDDLQHIVDAVGGLPLGMVLAATWIDTLSIAEIAEEIQANLDFLSAEMGDMPERQRSIHAVIEPTWKKLNDDERKAFMYTSVFRGGFSREIFQNVTGVSVRIFQSLLHRSLIHHVDGKRYNIHPLLKQYALEKLETHKMLDDARSSHLAAILDYALVQKEKLYSGGYLDALNAFEEEQDNFRAALDRKFSGTDLQSYLDLIDNLSVFWSARAQIREAIHYIEQAVIDAPDNPRFPMFLGFDYYRMGEMDKAESNLLQAITLAEELHSFDVLANSYRILTLVYQHKKPIEELLEHLKKALEFAQKSGNQITIAACHTTIGTLLADMGEDSTIVLEHHQKGLAIYEELGDLQGISRIIYNMAIVYHHLGDTKRARELCKESLSLKQKIGDKAGIARRLSVLASWDIAEEELERAREYLAESRIICEELGEQRRLSYTLGVESLLQIVVMDYENAQTLMERGLSIAQTINDYMQIEQFHSYLALLYLLQGHSELAKSHVLQAIEAHKKPSVSVWLCIVAYVRYLWHSKALDDCIPIAAITFHHGVTDDLSNRYFLQPLYYNIQQEIGELKWQEACNKALGITIEDLFQEIVNDLKIA
ncbi:MAG: tetratricopeptide repeat protein [Phototrophicaceae bacterium]